MTNLTITDLLIDHGLQQTIDAIASLEKALKEDPKDVESHVMLAISKAGKKGIELQIKSQLESKS